jgi:hypothetical protein
MERTDMGTTGLDGTTERRGGAAGAVDPTDLIAYNVTMAASALIDQGKLDSFFLIGNF